VTDSTTKQRATARLREAEPTKGYGGSGLAYFDGGWPGPIPLPMGQKKPPPEGYTGKAAPYPDRAQVQEWCADNPDGNLALRLHDGVIAVDVDNYDCKDGLATLAAFEKVAGCSFPPTWTSTSRSDGSAQRFYRVPEGRLWPSGLPGSGVELIHPGHRYSVVYPSINPKNGQQVRWRDAEGAVSLVVPSPKDLAELPPELVDALTATAAQPTELASEGAATTLLDGLPDGPMSAEVERVLEAALEELPGSRHDSARRYVNLLIRKGEHGEAGVRDALGELRAAFVALVVDRESSRDAEREFRHIVSSGARLIAGDPTHPWELAAELYLRTEAGLEGLRLASESLALGGWWFEYAAAHSGADHSAERATWAPVDVATDRKGKTSQPPVILAREDGECLFYAGKVHSVHGESESGKSWFVQCAAAECLNAGKPVLYVDFEDDVAGIANRLILLGVSEEVVDNPELFVYVRPEQTFAITAERAAFAALLAREFEFVVIDGVTDAMGLFGYSVKDNDHISTWQRDVPRTIARRTGAAVACVDHVSRDTEGRGRFALGGQHKLAGLDGAAFVVEMEKPFAQGIAGVASVRVGKDRPGQLRNIGGRWRKGDRTQHIADFHLDSTNLDRTEWTIAVPKDGGQPTDIDHSTSTKTAGGTDRPVFRPTWFMERVSRYWESTPNAAQRTLTKTVDAMCAERKASGKELKRDSWRAAIKLLIVEEYAKEEREGSGRQSTFHHSVTPYRQIDDPASDTYVAEADRVSGKLRVNAKLQEGREKADPLSEPKNGDGGQQSAE